MRPTKKNNRVALVCGLAGFQMASRQFLGTAIGSSPSVKREPELCCPATSDGYFEFVTNKRWANPYPPTHPIAQSYQSSRRLTSLKANPELRIARGSFCEFGVLFVNDVSGCAALAKGASERPVPGIFSC
jgi:hypothetical protein